MSRRDQKLEDTLPLARKALSLDTVLLWVLCGYLVLLPVGDLLLQWGSTLAAGNELTRDRGRFAVVNALTLTGFEGVITARTYPLPGQVVIFALTLLGALAPTIVGGMALVRILRLPYSDLRVALAGVMVCALAMVLGAMPLIEGGRSPLEAFMLSLSAYANSGLYLGRLPEVVSWQTQLVLLPLAVIGSLGVTVLMEAGDALLRRKPLSLHARTALGMTAGLYLVFFILFVVIRWADAPESAGVDMTALLASSSTASLNSRTLGFPFEFAGEFPRMMQWILILAMMIGGNSAGTAGGLKMTTVAELVRGARRSLRGEAPGRGFGIAFAWVGTYLGMALAILLAMLWLSPQVPADRLLLETISALSNAGISGDPIGFVGAPLDVLSVAMLLGRLMPLGVLWWMARTTRGQELGVG